MRTIAYIYTFIVLAYPPYAILTDEKPEQVAAQEYKPEWLCDCGARQQLRWNDPERLEFTEINGNLK